MKDEEFDELKVRYQAEGHRLYIVGGTSRDLLLGREYADEDFATDATPEEERVFLPDASYSFAQYGSIRVRGSKTFIDVTTLRVETGYDDFRHPTVVQFVKEPKLDYVRRDFTINALYLDEDYRLLDFADGLMDLKKKVIRFIGDPEVRIQEDPLRMIRAERLATKLGFDIEPRSLAAIQANRYLLHKISPAKIQQERAKGWKGKL